MIFLPRVVLEIFKKYEQSRLEFSLSKVRLFSRRVLPKTAN